MKKIKPIKAWAVCDVNGKILEISLTKNDAKYLLEWEYGRKGINIIRVEVRPII